MNIPNPPETEHELMRRAREMAGLSFADIAEAVGVRVPKNFKKHKGWTGQLIESFLGASAGSKPQQDFVELGIELKTLPLTYSNTPSETTYVCFTPLLNLQNVTWETSNVKNKLQKVLWVPVQGEREIPVAERLVGTPLIWTPSIEQEQALKQDWEELTELITLGHIESITAKVGEVMQLRPKAANGRALTDAIGINGKRIKTRPRGYYLRKEFTQSILESHF